MEYSLPDILESEDGAVSVKRAEADYLEQEYDSFNEVGEVLLGDGKNLYGLTPTDNDGEYVADCIGVLNPDTYRRIMDESPEVFPGEDPFKVVADFIRSDQAYWDPEKRESLGEDESYFDSSVADRSVRKALADGSDAYTSPAERDWSRITSELGE